MMSIEPHATNRRRRRVKLIFNPGAGAARGSRIEILDVIHELQAWQFVPETYLVEPGCDLSVVVQNALAAGHPHVRGLRRRWHDSCGRRSLDWHARHPGDHPHRHAEQRGPQPGHPGGCPGRRRHPPQRPAHQGGHWFGGKRADRAAVPPGLCGGGRFGHFPGGRRYPARQPHAHRRLPGNTDRFPRRPRCTWCWTTSTRSTRKVTWRWSPTCPTSACISGLATIRRWSDGLLDVLLFTDLSKMELLGYAAQKVVGLGSEDPRIQHFRARTVDIDTQPVMPVMADGLVMGEGSAAHLTYDGTRAGS